MVPPFAAERYQNDPRFHALVTTLEQVIMAAPARAAAWTPTEAIHALGLTLINLGGTSYTCPRCSSVTYCQEDARERVCDCCGFLNNAEHFTWDNSNPFD